MAHLRFQRPRFHRVSRPCSFPLLTRAGWALLLAAVVVQGSAQNTAPRSTPTSAQTPTLKFAPCRLDHPLGLGSVEAQCGSLSVSEDRSASGGRRIDLFVARVPALSRKSQRDPLFILAGGPGLGASTFYASLAPVFARVRRDRDIVIVDQRGTGRSAPLTCAFDEGQIWDADDTETVKVMRECRDQLSQQHDLAQYTTSIAVRDLEAVRIALGYAQINLYGSSYGTRVAQHYARRYPAHARALILDGIVPPAQVLGVTTPLDAESALQRIFARCREQAACLRAFGDPEQDYLDLRSKLDAASVPLELSDPRSGKPLQIEFSAQMLAGALRLAGYSADQAALLPLVLHLANRDGQFAPLAAQFLMTAASYDAVIAYGMHNSVVCAEDVPLFDDKAVDLPRLQATFLGTAQVDSLRQLCLDWPRGAVDKDLHAPLDSPAPALLLSGTADPVTPAAFGDEAALGFRSALHLKFIDQGHGQLGQPCVDRLMAEFLTEARPGVVPKLDAACVERLRPPPFFLTLNGPGP